MSIRSTKLVAVVRWIDGEAIDGFLKRLLAASITDRLARSGPHHCVGMRVASIPGAVCLRRSMFPMSSKVSEFKRTN